MKSGSLAFHVSLYFASNPLVTLNSTQISEMFGVAHAPERLQDAVNAGFLEAAGGIGKGNLRSYRAGPRIKKIANLEVPR